MDASEGAKIPGIGPTERMWRSKRLTLSLTELRLNLRRVYRRRCSRRRLEADFRVRSIAERLVRRCAAAAQRNCRLARQIPLPAIRIQQFDRTFNAKWTIWPHRDLHFVSLRFVLSHNTLLENNSSAESNSHIEATGYHGPTRMLTLDEAQVRRHLTYEALIPALEQALIHFSTGAIKQPVRTILPVPEHHGVFGLMPAIMSGAGGDLMGVKLVTFYHDNTTLPTHQAVIQLFSASTGEPLAALDGRLITEMRTAAVTAIAARVFTPHRPLTLAILGSGVQARAHLHALRLVREIKKFRVWSRSPAHADAFARETGAVSLSLEEAMDGADIVIGVANVSEPLILGKYLSPTAFVAAIAAAGANKRELDDEAMRASIIVESRESALRESGDIIETATPIYAELGEILARKIPPPPTERRVVYKGLGIAAEDLAAARLVYEAATAIMPL